MSTPPHPRSTSPTQSHPSQPPFFRRARIVGVVCALLALACCAGFLLTGSRAAVVHSGRWVLGAESGCLVIGRATGLVTQFHSNMDELNSRLGLVTHDNMYGSFAGAWRPFRAGGPRESRVLFPLWQPMLALGLLAAFAFGTVTGGMRARRGYCSTCGYDLRGLAKDAACPECGKSSEPEAPARVGAR
ncbi:MAG: hypothetical protein AABZ53_07580 [Planctomycetota bacterium]